MNAPTAIDRYLRSSGFGYGPPYYQRWSSHAPVIEALLFGKQSSGVLVHIKAIYPMAGGGLQISPLESEVLYRDGQIDGMPVGHERRAYWTAADWGTFAGVFEESGCTHLQRLATAGLMIETYEYLLERRSPVPAFPAIDAEWISRKSTPLRLSCLAAYLNVAGRYDEALDTIQQLKRPTPFDEKLRRDARLGVMADMACADAYLQGIGASSLSGSAQ